MSRPITHCYRDPLSEVWLACAHRMGLRVERSDEAFAHSDGQGTFQIATDQHLDADDCLTQMIFHELCHSLIEGPESFKLPDWGLDNRSHDDDEREHATLRLQAFLAGRYGLREMLAPTTDFREFYDALGTDPLAPKRDSSVKLAIVGIRRASTNPWSPHLAAALAATSDIAAIAKRFAAPSAAPVLYRLYRQPLAPHPTGLAGRTPAASETCGSCAWRNQDGHCFQANQAVDASLAACERYEPALDCQDCGACCREAYHSVTIADGDEVAVRHPSLVVHRDSYIELRREDGHCVALKLSGDRYSCTIYDDRPTCCREFENAGEHCLTARRRVGLSL